MTASAVTAFEPEIRLRPKKAAPPTMRSGLLRKLETNFSFGPATPKNDTPVDASIVKLLGVILDEEITCSTVRFAVVVTRECIQSP
jgi:hypothetical protein